MNTHLALTVLVAGLCVPPLCAQQSSYAAPTLEVDPYAKTHVDSNSSGLQVVTVNPSEINVLSSNLARLSPELKMYAANYMFLWVHGPKEAMMAEALAMRRTPE